MALKKKLTFAGSSNNRMKKTGWLFARATRTHAKRTYVKIIPQKNKTFMYTFKIVLSLNLNKFHSTVAFMV